MYAQAETACLHALHVFLEDVIDIPPDAHGPNVLVQILRQQVPQAQPDLGPLQCELPIKGSL